MCNCSITLANNTVQPIQTKSYPIYCKAGMLTIRDNYCKTAAIYP